MSGQRLQGAREDALNARSIYRSRVHQLRFERLGKDLREFERRLGLGVGLNCDVGVSEAPQLLDAFTGVVHIHPQLDRQAVGFGDDFAAMAKELGQGVVDLLACKGPPLGSAGFFGGEEVGVVHPDPREFVSDFLEGFGRTFGEVRGNRFLGSDLLDCLGQLEGKAG